MDDNYTINDMRKDLAATIKALKDNESGMTVEKAKAIGELSQTLINSAKVEVEMLKTVGRGRMAPTGFIALEHQDTLTAQEKGSPANRVPPSLPSPTGASPNLTPKL